MLNPESEKPAPPLQPPLIRNEKLEIDPETGGQIETIRYQRGVRVLETRKYDIISFMKAVSAETPRQRMQKMCEALRDSLEAKRLPTDHHPHWVKIDHGEWRENSEPIDKLVWNENCERSNWYSRLKALTEELSDERAAGDLLWSTLQMLKQPGIDPFLWHIQQYAQRVAGKQVAEVNHFAHMGLSRGEALSAGSKARRANGIEVAEVVRECANACWSLRPGLRNVASATAELIKDEVNTVLQDRSLLPPGKKGLSIGTIARYIRKEFGG